MQQSSKYADWYAQQGYQVSVAPPPRELPEFLRTLAPDIIARRDGENIVIELKTSSPASSEAVQRLATALEHRAGWKLQVVYVDLPDLEWQPPPRLPETNELLARLDVIAAGTKTRIRGALSFSYCGRYSKPPLVTGSRS
ncbi:MAG: hypothetical protein JO081_20840 [Alphaproteobacteria bacterium]|nr:hypothetical protein [Alphaproteobacteria bacterium]